MDLKIALLIISAKICATLALPPCTCTRNLNPVCGSDGVEYSNPCLLECAAHNSGKTITVEKQGPCHGSIKKVALPEACDCPNFYQPVCGSDGQTYANECDLNCKKSSSDPSLKIVYSAPCGTAATTPMIMCPLYLQEMCGSDGTTYPNDCYFKHAQLRNPGLQIDHQGPCEN